MDDKLLVALVAGAAALFGSLIPTVFGYLNNKSQREFEMKKSLREKQRQVYSDLMLSLQRTINASGNNVSLQAAMIEFQREVLQASLYGDDSTAVASTAYYKALMASAQPGASFVQAAEHQYHQGRILNAMRASMGLKPLDSFGLVGIGSPHGA